MQQQPNARKLHGNDDMAGSGKRTAVMSAVPAESGQAAPQKTEAQQPRKGKEPNASVYDLEFVLPGSTFQGDVIGLDYVDNATTDRLYAYAAVSVLSARIGSAAAQSFLRTQPGQTATRPHASVLRPSGEELESGAPAVEDQDIVEYLDRYLFKEYAATQRPIELDPLILFSSPYDVDGLKLADAVISRQRPYRLTSHTGARKLAQRWRETHPALWQANQRYQRYLRPLTSPILWAASLAGMGGLVIAALLAVAGSITIAGVIGAVSAVPPFIATLLAFTYMTTGLAARRRLIQAIVTAIQEELNTGFPTASSDVSPYPGFAVKANLTRHHPLFRSLVTKDDFLSAEMTHPQVHQVFALGRRIFNRLAGRGNVTTGLIMLVSTDKNLSAVLPQLVADTIKAIPQYHYSDPTHRGSVFGIIMRPWHILDLPFASRYLEAASRCSLDRWQRRNPLPEEGPVEQPSLSTNHDGERGVL